MFRDRAIVDYKGSRLRKMSKSDKSPSFPNTITTQKKLLIFSA